MTTEHDFDDGLFFIIGGMVENLCHLRLVVLRIRALGGSGAVGHEWGSDKLVGE